jgi:molybdate transport system substrate-binding protein
MPRIERLAAVATASMVLAGCGIASGDERITLQVLAASSLTDAFGELGAAYQTAYKRVTVRLKFAGSQELASDVKNREPADVLATADNASMNDVVTKVSDQRAFAHNSMTIAVTPGNPKRLQGLANLTDPRLRVVLGGPAVPVGRYAQQVLVKAGITVRPRSEEADARTVLTRIRTGVADAGLVYVTDMRSAGISATSVAIPLQQNVTATYFAAAVRRGHHGTAAKSFVTWLSSSAARTILQKYGFTPA